MAATAVILDLDGTVWDSYPLYAEVLHSAASVSREQTMSALHGGDSIVRLLQAAGVSRTRFGRFVEKIASETILYPGINRALRKLSAGGLPLGVVTSLPGWIALPLLSAVGQRDSFAEVVHAGSGVARKPNPAGIHKVLNAVGVASTERVFYVGDQDRDAQTARRAGVSFAWASYGYNKTAPGFITARLEAAAEISSL